MFRFYVLCILGLLSMPACGAEKLFDFTHYNEDEVPSGFRSAVSGEGKPGDWRIVLDAVAPTLAPLTPEARTLTKRPVLAQVAQDRTDEHFPLFIYEGEEFRDFELTTRFKTVQGLAERMAGIAFRIQNESNYYVVRASSLGNSFRFYKVVNGQRGEIIGPQVPIASGVWHDLSVACAGNQIRCSLDGKQLIPTITDTTFVSGKIGFWTKSDSVSYFADTKIVYTPREPPAQALVRATLKHYSRLIGLKMFVAGADTNSTRVIASNDETEIGGAGGKAERDVLNLGAIYYGKTRDSVEVTMPLRDRNGDIISAVRVVMKTFRGQTEKSAVERAAPVVRSLQAQVQSLQDLTD